MFVLPLPVSAATETSAGVKPGQFLYFFDTTFEKVDLFFTFGSENKAKKALEYADERLAEAKESANENNPKAVEKAMAGYKAEISLATLGGKANYGFKTSTGWRFVDLRVGNSIHESKVGYTTLDRTVRRQIEKDVELLRIGKVNNVVWHFFESPVIGKKIPARPLLSALESGGTRHRNSRFIRENLLSMFAEH